MTKLQSKIIGVSNNQLDLLKGFYLHCWSVFHQDVKQDFDFFAKTLDSAGISWRVQNVVAQIAEDYSSMNYYLKTSLKTKNIVITNK